MATASGSHRNGNIPVKLTQLTRHVSYVFDAEQADEGVLARQYKLQACRYCVKPVELPERFYVRFTSRSRAAALDASLVTPRAQPKTHRIQSVQQRQTWANPSFGASQAVGRPARCSGCPVWSSTLERFYKQRIWQSV